MVQGSGPTYSAKLPVEPAPYQDITTVSLSVGAGLEAPWNATDGSDHSAASSISVTIPANANASGDFRTDGSTPSLVVRSSSPDTTRMTDATGMSW
ncbi:hypothetical protein [Candidatus Spongiisocius sp.]|uniref:hypothetical protein n=1 Tax=Candidatus Spongiisocius sp. TaxID=3101273 RepID=UPI003B5BF0E6